MAFRVQEFKGLGFRVYDSGYRILGTGFRGQVGLGFRALVFVSGLGFRVQGSGFRV